MMDAKCSRRPIGRHKMGVDTLLDKSKAYSVRNGRPAVTPNAQTWSSFIGM
jgi:hypothetical protein